MLTPVPRNGREDVREVAGFIAPRCGLWHQIPRQEVRPICLQQQPLGGNACDQLFQVRTTALIADPARDADTEPERETVLELTRVAGKTMCDGSRQLRQMFAQDRDKIGMRSPLVEKNRLAQLHGQLELQAKNAPLVFVRRIVPKVIEPAFSGGTYLACEQQLPQHGQISCRELRGVVRMNAGGRANDFRIRARQIDCAARALERRTRDDEMRDARGARTLDHLGPIVIVAVVSEIDADVDEIQGHCKWLRKLRDADIACYLAAPGKRRVPSRGAEDSVNVNCLQKLCIALALISSATAAQELDLDDLESRIEYAWFTEDANSLRSLIQTVDSALLKSGNSPLARYQLGFAHYRLGLVLMQKSDANAADALTECIEQLDQSIEADEKFADAYALQAACYGTLAGIRAWTAVVNGPQSTSRIEKALKLAPGNPRVVLLDGVADRERPRAVGGDKARAQTKFERAMQLFEETGSRESGGPRWGAADAYFYVGRGLLEAGDTLGARNALERALIIAPEFSAARRELRRLSESAR